MKNRTFTIAAATLTALAAISSGGPSAAQVPATADDPCEVGEEQVEADSQSPNLRPFIRPDRDIEVIRACAQAHLTDAERLYDDLVATLNALEDAHTDKFRKRNTRARIERLRRPGARFLDSDDVFRVRTAEADAIQSKQIIEMHLQEARKGLAAILRDTDVPALPPSVRDGIATVRAEVEAWRMEVTAKVDELEALHDELIATHQTIAAAHTDKWDKRAAEDRLKGAEGDKRKTFDELRKNLADGYLDAAARTVRANRKTVEWRLEKATAALAALQGG